MHRQPNPGDVCYLDYDRVLWRDDEGSIAPPEGWARMSVAGEVGATQAFLVVAAVKRERPTGGETTWYYVVSQRGVGWTFDLESMPGGVLTEG